MADESHRLWLFDPPHRIVLSSRRAHTVGGAVQIIVLAAASIVRFARSLFPEEML
jgi:hypothetical protein